MGLLQARILEWVAYPRARGSSWPWNWTRVSCITGEGNGTPLQCSCLENPRDGGAWWAAVYGVAQSQTRLKWLSRSSSSSCITGGFFTIWATREAPLCVKQYTLAVGEAYVSFSCGTWDLRCVMLEPSLLHTDSTCGVRAQQLWCAGSRAHRLQKLCHAGLGTPQQCKILVPWPGIEPASPGLQGGFLTTGPPVVIYTFI